MALIHALLSFKKNGEISSFDLLDDNKAYISLRNGERYVVFMAGEYILGATEIAQAVGDNPHPDFIIYNGWGRVTAEAERESKRHKIQIVKFGRFRYMLADLNARFR